jgi:N6-adenosine-specific RNA methylase IME4/ParB-like chromosome segregation protein Spo0J
VSTPRRERQRRASRRASSPEIARAEHEVAAGAGDRPQPQQSTNELRLHLQAEIVPEMSAEEYAPFVADVAERGILTPLEVTAAGVVLDGRARLRAAIELGFERVPTRIVEPEDEAEHMLRSALRRRHLSASQKAALALELADYHLVCEQADKMRRANLRQATEVATLPPRGERSREYAARVSGAGERTVQDAATVREADPALFEEIKAGTLPAHRAAQRVRRERRYAEIGPAPQLPSGRFDLIYADPPWQVGNPVAEYAPENYYPTLSLDEIKQLAVPAAENACLFLCVVNSLLPEAIEVIRAWGFTYKTNFCWDKGSIGLGVWARYRHELLLFAVRGDVSPPEPGNRCDSVIESKRRRHSEKPACVYELIERMYPGTAKLELFCRGKAHAGWTAWGNEVTQ